MARTSVGADVRTYGDVDSGKLVGMAFTVVFANFKGGSSKTTSTAYVGQAMADAGLSVLLVDADPQASLTRWAEAAEWAMPTIGLATNTLHRQLPGVVGDHDVVLIDTPPLDEARSITAAALRVSDLVVVPTAASPLEIERLVAVRDALEDVGPLRPSGGPPQALVVLTRVIANVVATGVWRDFLVSDGWNVAAAEVRQREAVKQAPGTPVTDTSPYTDVVAELLEIMERLA